MIYYINNELLLLEALNAIQWISVVFMFMSE